MIIAGREISAEEARYYYERNKRTIATRRSRFGPNDQMNQAYERWNRELEEEYGDMWKTDTENTR